MKNPFPSIGKAFKWFGKKSFKVIKSDLAREIAAAAFTLGGLPRIGNAIRVVDSAIEGGASWELLKGQLIERAIKTPAESALILQLIGEFEAKLRPVK